MSHRLKRIPFAVLSATAVLVLCACGPQTPQQPVGRNSQLMAVDTPPPEYPLRQACDGIGGIVELDVQVGADGKVSGSQVYRSSGVPELDAAAQAAVTKWKFEPAYVNGKAVAKKIRSPMSFKAPEEPNPLCEKPGA